MSIGPWDFGGFDIAVLVLLLISGLMAMGRGFMREIVSLIALFVGLVVALFLFGRFQGAALDLIQPSWLANWTLGLGAFALSYMLVTFLLRSMVKKLQGREPGGVDRLMGFGYGIFRGLLITSLFVIIFTQFARVERHAFIKEATLYPVIKPITEVMLVIANRKDEAEDKANEIIERGRDAALESERDSDNLGDEQSSGQPQN